MDQAAADTVGEELGAEVSPHLGAWLKSRNVCLLVSSYQSGRLILIGADSRGRVVIRHERFDRAMGMAVRNGSLLLATLHQLWLFKLTRRLSPGAADAGTMIVPQASYHTGFVNCHDVAWVGRRRSDIRILDVQLRRHGGAGEQLRTAVGACFH